MFDFRNYSTKSNYYDNLNKLGTEKMKDETEDVAIENLLDWSPKMYSFLVEKGEHKKTQGVNKNAVHNEYS